MVTLVWFGGLVDWLVKFIHPFLRRLPASCTNDRRCVLERGRERFGLKCFILRKCVTRKTGSRSSQPASTRDETRRDDSTRHDAGEYGRDLGAVEEDGVGDRRRTICGGEPGALAGCEAAH